jgi:hypothetical protein
MNARPEQHRLRPLLMPALALAQLLPLTAQAISPVPEETGWGGYFMLGGGYTEVKSNTVAGNDIIDGGNDTIKSINQKPSSNELGHLLAGIEIRYTLPDRNQIFLGGSLEDRLTLDLANQFGWRKQTDSSGIFQVGILFSAIPVEVWEDPYLVGTRRDATDRDSTGLRFEWGRIMGSAFDALLQVRESDIETERSGSDPGLGCDLGCQALLDRNGNQYQARLTYTFTFPGGHFLRPQLRLRSEDLDGAAMARDAWDLQLTYSYMRPGWILVANAIYGESSFDKANPLYGRRQDADTLALEATVLYSLPTASRRWQLTGGAFWGEADSAVRFHDNKLTQVFLGVIYNFGQLPGR